MAYDEELAGRIRQLIGSDPELTDAWPGHAWLVACQFRRSAPTISSSRGVEMGTGYARSLPPK